MNVRVYGPYTSKIDGRQRVVIYSFEDNIRKTISYPKWLMEQKLGRELDPNLETIDHLDTDFLNNADGNMSIKDRVSHVTEDTRRVEAFTLVCIWCNKTFKTKRPGDRIRANRIGCAGPFCSRRCQGQYGAELQNNRINKLPYSDLPDRKYYTLKEIGVK